jgi:hypothetical protein
MLIDVYITFCSTFNRREKPNDQRKKDKMTNNNVKNIHIKLKTEKHEPH